MTDSPSRDRQNAQSLKEISHHLKELVKVVATMNENFVSFVKKLQDADMLDVPETEESTDWGNEEVGTEAPATHVHYPPFSPGKGEIWVKPGENIRVWSREHKAEGVALASDSEGRVKVTLEGVASPLWLPRDELDILDTSG